MVKVVSTGMLPRDVLGSDAYGWSGATEVRTDEAEDQAFNAWLERHGRKKEPEKPQPKGIRGGRQLWPKPTEPTPALPPSDSLDTSDEQTETEAKPKIKPKPSPILSTPDVTAILARRKFRVTIKRRS